MLGVMLALAHWRHLLQGEHEFDIWTDHKNLEYFKSPQKLNRRQARWFSEMASYNFKLQHQPGRLNIVADVLSRKDQAEEGVEDNTNMVLLPPEHFTTTINGLSFHDEEEILEEI
jgi:hypothetical protein